MRVALTSRLNNDLLDMLPAPDRLCVMNHAEPFNMVADEILAEQGRAMEFAVFPQTAIISESFAFDSSPQIEFRTIGPEGFVGLSLALSSIDSITRMKVLQAGTGLKIAADVFLFLVQSRPALKKCCDRYILTAMSNAIQRLACNRVHSAQQRMTQKLLIWQHRNRSDQFSMTHQLMADMIGVQRSTVSEIASHLQALRLIRYNHGQVRILNRLGLEKLSCGCFDIALQINKWNLEDAS